jgi:hypothetical protein
MGLVLSAISSWVRSSMGEFKSKRTKNHKTKKNQKTTKQKNPFHRLLRFTDRVLKKSSGKLWEKKEEDPVLIPCKPVIRSPLY